MTKTLLKVKKTGLQTLSIFYTENGSLYEIPFLPLATNAAEYITNHSGNLVIDNAFQSTQEAILELDQIVLQGGNGQFQDRIANVESGIAKIVSVLKFILDDE